MARPPSHGTACVARRASQGSAEMGDELPVAYSEAIAPDGLASWRARGGNHTPRGWCPPHQAQESQAAAGSARLRRQQGPVVPGRPQARGGPGWLREGTGA